jgi:lipopolysaccharide biosynthesis regulator YciM
MSKEGLFCKKYLLDLDWDKAVAESPEKEDSLSSEDYANFAYARCFQMTKNHKDGSYDDVIEAASKALIKDDQNNRALCIRAYGYYLNDNYERAIVDCESVTERTSRIIESRKQVIAAWQTAYEEMAKAEETKKTTIKRKRKKLPQKPPKKRGKTVATRYTTSFLLMNCLARLTQA